MNLRIFGINCRHRSATMAARNFSTGVLLLLSKGGFIQSNAKPTGAVNHPGACFPFQIRDSPTGVASRHK